MAEVVIGGEAPRNWVKYKEDTEVLLQYLDREEGVALNKKVDRIVAKTGGDHPIIFSVTLGAQVVYGWRHRDQKKFKDHPGLTVGGKPFEFSETNRDKIMRFDRDFAMFVQANSINMDVFQIIEDEKKEKIAAKNG